MAREVDGRYSWVILAASFYLFICCSLPFAFGIVIETCRREVGVSYFEFAWVNATATIFAYFGVPWGWLGDKKGHRLASILACIVSTVGLTLTANATQLWHYIVGYGVITGFGLGGLCTCTVAIVNLYFSKYRNFANSFLACSPPLTIIVSHQAGSYFLDRLGCMGTFYFFAACLANGCVASALLLPLEQPGRLVSLPCTEESDDQNAKNIPLINETRVAVCAGSLPNIPTFRTQNGKRTPWFRYAGFLFVFFASEFATMPFWLYLHTILTILELDNHDIFTTIALVDVAARICFSLLYAFTNIDPLPVLFTATAICAIVTSMLPTFLQQSAVITACVWAVTQSARNGSHPTVSLRTLPQNNFSLLVGTYFTAGGLGSFAGQLVMGALLDTQTSLSVTTLLFGMVLVLPALLLFISNLLFFKIFKRIYYLMGVS